ncbi:MAG: 30S ribosomal protein S20 [Candidatus Poribacteria bacterium]|nr:30S ribosomal protein S20 [Candidatus Poribacteria bacterium]
MANLPSSKKHIRADERKRVRNRLVKTAMRSALRNARTGITSGADDTQSLLTHAISQLDKAAKKGIIKKQTAARRKSRLMKAYNREVAQAG